MDDLFLVQLTASFLVGGTFIAFLSFISEKASEKIAGIIISLPSTIVISYFFIGWALSPNAIKEIAPAAPATIGIVMLFTVTYLYLSKIEIKKLSSIALCTLGSLSVWFLLAIPLAVYQFSNIWISLGIYLLCAGFAYIFLTKLPKEKSNHVAIKYSISSNFFVNIDHSSLPL